MKFNNIIIGLAAIPLVLAALVPFLAPTLEGVVITIVLIALVVISVLSAIVLIQKLGSRERAKEAIRQRTHQEDVPRLVAAKVRAEWDAIKWAVWLTVFLVGIWLYPYILSQVGWLLIGFALSENLVRPYLKELSRQYGVELKKKLETQPVDTILNNGYAPVRTPVPATQREPIVVPPFAIKMFFGVAVFVIIAVLIVAVALPLLSTSVNSGGIVSAGNAGPLGVTTKFPPLPDKNGIKIANIEVEEDRAGGFHYFITFENTNNIGFAGTVSMAYVLYGETETLSDAPIGMVAHKKWSILIPDRDTSRPADPNFHVVSFETTGRKSNS